MADGTWTGGDARRCARAAFKKSAEHTSEDLQTADARMAVSNEGLKSRLRKFWQEHSEGFTQMWTGLSIAEKRNYLEASVAHLPRSRTDKLKNGQSTLYRSLVTPELNVKDLVSNGEGSLIALYENWGNSELEKDLQHARLMAENLLTNNKHFKPIPDEFVMLADVENFARAGEVFVCKDGSTRESFRRLVTRGVALRADVYDLANDRLNKILLDLLLWADTYRREVLKLPGFFVASAMNGCVDCGRIESLEGGELRRCCGSVPETVTSFCSKKCQRAVFASHIAECPRLQKARETRTSDACQVCGDLQWEGGGALRTCARCNGAQYKYCSRECQVTAWIKAGHKRECQMEHLGTEGSPREQ